MGCNAPLGYDDECEGDCEGCDYWDGKYDDEECDFNIRGGEVEEDNQTA